MKTTLGDSTLNHRGAEMFQTTHWSIVLLAGQHRSQLSAEALEKLCRSYWFPLYAYVRCKGHDAEEAEDLTQEFFLRLLEKDYLTHADRSKGKFRSFLLTALNHFLVNDWRRAQAVKRGSGQAPISFDDPSAECRYALEPASHLTPERLYERRWALTLLDAALGRLRDEYTAAGAGRQFERLRGFLTTEAGESHHATVAAELGTTAGAVGVAVHRLRRRYRELVRAEIANTIASQAEVEEEIRWLFAAVGNQETG
jgi:RNA polymerase sigma-70 factor (ECF subfamily)